MRTHLDDANRPIDDVATDLIDLASALDHRHRQHRKTKFILDIRGYIAMNRIDGDYVEFGLYRGEMMFSAHHILDHLGRIRRYVGFDNFSGEPEMTAEEAMRLPFLKVGDYRSDELQTRNFLSRVIGVDRVRLVVGDFRDPASRAGEPADVVVVGVIDCNLETSIAAALDAVVPKMAVGGALYLDDYYLNLTQEGLWHEKALHGALDRHGRSIVDFSSYPPCGRAVLVF